MVSPRTITQLSGFIRKRALELGFAGVGIAPAERMDPESHRLQTWLDDGYQATMRWIESRAEERKNICEYFPEARSVVSLAMNYYHGNANGKLKVSNYAWGDDYHDVLKARLDELLNNIRELSPEIEGLVCVDTSPIMEKAWAKRAGIGWIGKHTNLITRDHGSWVFIGELILNCELDYDEPFVEDLCGSCTACLEACPTGAIVQEYRVDARLCISYLTIEHRGKLPHEMSDRLDGWIYGCDVCQEVCPWNLKFAKKSQDKSFAPRPDIVERSQDQWRGMTREDYRRIFRNSAIKRARFEGLERNIEANRN